MINFIQKVFSGKLMEEIINNFDPYHINELTRLELNKKENKHGTLGKN